VSDPFAPEPDQPPAPVETNNDAFETEEPYSVTQTPDEVSLTFKAGPGFDAPWVVLRTSTIFRALEFLGGSVDANSTEAEALAQVFQRAAKAASGFHTVYGPSSGGNGTSGGSAPGRSNGRPQGATQAPEWAGSAPTCPHGTRVYKTKIGNNGSPWHAWACPGPQGNSCDGPRGSDTAGLIFINKPK
jgi:hypothetical protein